VPDTLNPGSATPSVRGEPETTGAEVDPIPEWFSQFLNDRQTRKPSAHTMKAYRQDFIAIATLVAGGDPSRLSITDITKDSMRTAFAAYARDHEAASIRRCWSTWNVLCTFLYTNEQLAANPMQLVGGPSWPNRPPEPFPAPQSKHSWKPSPKARIHSAKPTEPSAISRLFSPACWPAYAPRNSARPTSAGSVGGRRRHPRS
jgi:hypothetical protein